MYFTQAVTEHDNTTTIEPVSTRELQERTLQVSNFASKNALDYVAHKLIVEAYSHNGGLELAKALLSTEPPPPDQSENMAIPWCICRKCRPMSTDAEKKCCRQRRCITLDPTFNSFVLDREALAVAIVHRSDFLLGCQFTLLKVTAKQLTASTLYGGTTVWEGETGGWCRPV